MTIATYSELKSSILNFLGRPSDPLIPTADLIRLFESDAARKLRTHHQVASATITTVGGTASYALPTDFLSMIEVKVSSATPVETITYMPPGQLDDAWPFSWSPKGYTIEGSEIRIGPPPDAAYTIQMKYYAKLVPLADDSDSATAVAIVTPGADYAAEDVLIASAGIPNDPVTLLHVDTVSVLDEFSATSLVIAEGGTEYTSGDIIVVAGGTASTPAQINVDAVDAVTGAVTSASIRIPGNYSVVPDNDAATTGGRGFSATFTIGWTQNGVAGEVQSVSILEAGDYATPPSNPVAVTGGSGDGNATFNLTYTANGGNTNWLLENYPDAYLFGSLAEASLFLGGDNTDSRFQIFLQRREEIYQQILLSDRKYRAAGSPLIARPDGATP
jgi:hypothetical protein